jgi:hypothetical protein
MIRQIIIAFATEGNTDIRFLESIIKRTFEYIAFECSQEIEIYDVHSLEKIPGNIEKKALDYARKAMEAGAIILCFHADADSETDQKAFEDRINPAFKAILNVNEDVCKNLIAIVPIQMTEAWMLVDEELLKKELGTKKSAQELGINKKPETFANPKEIIENAITIARKEFSKRRRRELNISELYQPIGQKIKLEKLNNLSSYKKFKEAVRNVFKTLGYLQ